MLKCRTKDSQVTGALLMIESVKVSFKNHDGLFRNGEWQGALVCVVVVLHIIFLLSRCQALRPLLVISEHTQGVKNYVFGKHEAVQLLEDPYGALI